jgi:hypothetical protein
MPAEAEFQVKVGDRVKGGASVIAMMTAGMGAATEGKRYRADSASVGQGTEEGDRR